MLLAELPLHTSQGPDCRTVVTRQLRMHLRFSEKHFFLLFIFKQRSVYWDGCLGSKERPLKHLSRVPKAETGWTPQVTGPH